ncbi:autotransporter domain-containing protein [Mesorhizobium sp. BR1-1-16]|uniref:autotransporter outer membrane beta-barrel domain-containing protein n=1 Tax=Mesorhizobium sp. BR1-1-16 TaxID=2876653 RepID=UPI001CCE9E67|nr:autotransporter domain-containing protein [Mesorhizobium sp. BR1-1-16]MBZ9938333.1 autotransporter domain-containing protein [Mesorhizobium sp. BR1-1-16]
MKNKPVLSGFPRTRALKILAVGLGAGAFASSAKAEPLLDFTYVPLNYGANGTFLTGIRGDNIVGNYTIPGTDETGGLYYNIAAGTWAALPETTANGANFPGAIGSSPYGPSFGTPDGILRAVGSYQTEASSPYDLSYLYDAAATPGQNLTYLAYPDGPGGKTLFTIAHSNFGNQAVGDYDTDLATGNAFIYNIDTGSYTTNNVPGAVSTTAYGIYGDKIAGGYGAIDPGSGLSLQHGYIYDQTTGTYTTYDHPGSIQTHFEGITSAGRANEYNLVVDWTSVDGVAHPSVMHLAADGSVSWYDIDIPGAVVSSNSAYGENVVGIYVVDGAINGYLATIPGMYNPISNEGVLRSGTENAVVLSGIKGDDLANSGSISVSGIGGVGLSGETYGVVANSGSVTASGSGGAAVEMHGRYGALLNSGTLQADFAADAVRVGADADGTVIVNAGIIDGRLNAMAGSNQRFENSGWLGISGIGLPVTDSFSGTFVQTAAGTLALRITESGNDSLDVSGTVRLAGTLATTIQATNLLKSYELVSATGGVTGAFDTVTTAGLPALFATSLEYAPTTVTIDVSSALGSLPATAPNRLSVGSAIDSMINGTSDNTLAALPASLEPLYALSASQLPVALAALSGEAYASEQSVLAGDSLYSRQAVLGRLRQGTYAEALGAMAALADGGPTVTGAVAKPSVTASGATLWGQAYGGWSNLDGDGDTSDVSANIGGIVSGVDVNVDRWRVGAALGYSRSNADVAALGSSFDVDSLLVALYAGTEAGPFNLRFGTSYAFNQIDADRTIAYPGSLQQANAQYDGGTAQVFGEVGYGFAVSKLALEPFAGLAYVNIDTQDFSESGASAGLAGSAESLGIGYSTLGIRAATNLALSGGMVLQPRAALAWQYAFGDTETGADLAFLSAPGATFSVSGVPIAENTALVELGADLLINPKARVGLSYIGQFADNVSDNALQANVAWSF